MKQGINRLALTALVLLGTGCVSQSAYDDLQDRFTGSKDQVISLSNQLEAQAAQLEDMQTREDFSAQLKSTIEKQNETIAGLTSDLSAAKNALLSAQINTELPEVLDQALSRLADENSDVLTYDSSTGLIKFKSDFTFTPGSDQVRATAKASLAKLADIVNLPAAANYEIQIVGHTDNVRISKPATKRLHPTNWHLSVHRANSVRKVLASAGVANTRIIIAGAGEYRPIAENAKGGSQANRRVEIYLRPLKRAIANTAGAAAPQPAVDKSPAEPIRLK